VQSIYGYGYATKTYSMIILQLLAMKFNDVNYVK